MFADIMMYVFHFFRRKFVICFPRELDVLDPKHPEEIWGCNIFSVFPLTFIIFYFSAGIVIEEKNWPPFFPLIHHDISNEIPIHLQRMQYLAFSSFLGKLLSVQNVLVSATVLVSCHCHSLSLSLSLWLKYIVLIFLLYYALIVLLLAGSDGNTLVLPCLLHKGFIMFIWSVGSQKITLIDSG